MELFTKEIEEINILKYGMSKVEDYYYLTLSDEDSVMLEEAEDDEEESGQEPAPSDDAVVVEEVFSKSLIISESNSTDITDERSSGPDSSAEGPSSLKTDDKKTSSTNLTPDSLEGEAAFFHEKSEDSSSKSSQVSGTESDYSGRKKEHAEQEEEADKEETLAGADAAVISKEDLDQTDESLSRDTKELQPVKGPSKQESQESNDVSTPVDLSVPLTVLTSPEEDHSCCEELVTPVSEFPTPVDATSTPIETKDQDKSLVAGKDSSGSSLITASHQSDDAAKQEKESPEGEKSSEEPPTSPKTSPRSQNERRVDASKKLNFWLVLRLCDNYVDIYFHAR